MPVTREDAEMLATLVANARPAKASRWDERGIMAAIAKVRHLELADVGMAAFRAARDRTVETPAPIGILSSPCWIERPIERPQPEKASPGGQCGICSHPRHDGRCPRCPLIEEHTWEPLSEKRDGQTAARIVAAVREEVKPLRTADDAEVARIAAEVVEKRAGLMERLARHEHATTADTDEHEERTA